MEKQTNCLLIKNEIGKARPFTRDLPVGDHTYGKRVQADEFSAKDLLSSWNTHEEKNQVDAGRDYKKMNKLACRSKITSARATTEFRNENEIKKVTRYETRPTGK